MHKEKSCGAVIMCIRDGKYYTLLVKHLAGHWGFPKGHMEADESEIDTAKREVAEETGLSVELDQGFRDISTYQPRPDTYKQVVYFIGKPEGGRERPDADEIEEVRWCSFSEAHAILSYPSDVAILENAQDYMRHVECME